MDKREEFLAWVSSRLHDAAVALHDEDADPRRSIWSGDQPVTVFGAWRGAAGTRSATNTPRPL